MNFTSLLSAQCLPPAAVVELVRPTTFSNTMSTPFDGMQHVIQNEQAMQEFRRTHAGRENKRYAAQIALPHLLSGVAMFDALNRAVQEVSGIAPNDCDVLILVGDLSVTKASFIEPHTFLFEGFTQDGHRSWVVCHFTQVFARVIFLPKRGEERIVSRVIQGFSPHEPSA
ncbi:MAG: hypothetical protein IH623_18575 [Verrucomicrobia bacterium]|nr:hypothetical protein [Verrucomicrobiota bacterium]